jgi:hypothetical protein
MSSRDENLSGDGADEIRICLACELSDCFPRRHNCGLAAYKAEKSKRVYTKREMTPEEKVARSSRMKEAMVGVAKRRANA